MQTIPMLSADLIEQLREAFPPLTAKSLSALTPEALQFHCGQQDIIDFLEMRLEQTKQDDLLRVRPQGTQG